jgi:hypothetical protein
MWLRTTLWAAALTACIPINMKTATTRSTTTTGSSSATTSGPPAPDPTRPATETENGVLTRRYEGMPPYPTAPQDPWLGVDGDQPRRLAIEPHELWTVRSNDHDCTAAVDHCLVNEAWLVEEDASARRSSFRTAHAFAFGPNGLLRPINARTSAGLPGEPFTAYRTVPATPRNLVVGALVMTLGFDKPTIQRGAEVFERTWNVGFVEKIDWDVGFVYLVGQPDRTYWITATRTAVLAWKPGEKVIVLGGRPRDQLTVRPDEIVFPDPR